MVLNYFGQRIKVNTKLYQLFDNIKEKYCPVVTIENDDDFNEQHNYSINLTIDSGLNVQQFNNYRRIIIHGGNRKEYYVTGLTKSFNDHVVIYIENYNTKIEVDYNNKNINCSSTDKVNLMKSFDLIIIELFYRWRETYMNDFHFHASAIADSNNEATIFIGKKNAGKSTFLIESILNHNMKYICNDNCFIHLENNKLYVVPWFEDIKIKTSTMRKYNINSEKFQKCEESIDKTKKFIPLSIFQSVMKFQAESIVNLKRVILLEYNELDNFINNGWDESWRDKLKENTKLPHDPEHYEFLGIFNEFSSDRFDKYYDLLEIMKNKVEFIHVKYNEDRFNEFYNRLLNLSQ